MATVRLVTGTYHWLGVSVTTHKRRRWSIPPSTW